VTARRCLLTLGAATLVAGGSACALDFDRFEPDDASTPPTAADVSTESTQADASADVEIAPIEEDADAAVAPDSGVDARALADGPRDDAPCMPSPSCIMTAQMCSATCTRNEQQCSMRCLGGGGCRTTCMRTETTCMTQCEDTCSSCTQSAGCSAASACGDGGVD
jgi:hypothetical protein